MIWDWRFGLSLDCPKVYGAFHNKKSQNAKGFIVWRLHGCVFLSPSIFDSNWTLQIADDIVVVSRRSCCRRIMPRIEIIPPVVHREFLVRSRAPITYWLRLGAAGAAFVVIVIAVSISLFSGMAGGLANGAGWFAFFSWCLWLFCLVEGVRQSFDMLSGEKREGTIGLLFLTQMRGLDVVLGKVSAGFIASFFPVLGALPILGILIFLGGVSGAEFARMSAALLATLGASLSAGIFVSARSIYAGKAWSAACGILLIWILSSMVGSAVGLPIPSPWTLFRNSFDSRYLADSSGFWVSFGNRFWSGFAIFDWSGMDNWPQMARDGFEPGRTPICGCFLSASDAKRRGSTIVGKVSYRVARLASLETTRDSRGKIVDAVGGSFCLCYAFVLLGARFILSLYGNFLRNSLARHRPIYESAIFWLAGAFVDDAH